ncbi:MAG: T9SS type A sorting domain-containing protein [Chitinophagaceae bacterium]
MKIPTHIPGRAQRSLLALLLFLSPLVSFSQTNINGIVNTYRQVVEIIPAKACVRVNNISGINVNTKILLVQMKGATISTANNATYGDTSSTNEAGLYEAGTICYIIGDSVFLFHNLANTYNTATGKVQLVQFAEYNSARVVDTLKAAAWNEANGTGGVIALYADQDIILNAPVYADSLGYSGGDYYSNSGTCNIVQTAGTGYVYNITATSSQNGAYKGEGIATVSSTQSAAKGAPANGGGGGNNHNNSGGGGANLTAGGNGGGNSSSGPVGCNTANNWGRGGKALSSWGGTKIFMGGGGGAGHANNGSTAYNYGGNGGGIIFIWANNIIGNGYTISADGGDGGASQSDGAGGGGAGGTIIMHVTNYTGTLTVQANGGSGGLSDDGGVGGRCFGGGGGGSGGIVYYTGAVPAVTTSVSAGAAGGEIGRDPGCNAAVSAAAGGSGSISSSYTFTRSFSAAGYCSLLLPSKLVYFKAALINKDVVLDWLIQNPELVKNFTLEKRNDDGEWVMVSIVEAVASKETYSATDHAVHPGENYYRLKVTEKTTAVYYSAVRRIYIDLTQNDFTIYPNPAQQSVQLFRKEATPAVVLLTDMSGKIILEKRIWNQRERLELPGVVPGIYLLRINQSVKKLVIH